MALELKAASKHVTLTGEPTRYEVTGLPEGHVAVIIQPPGSDSWQLLHWTSTQESDWTRFFNSKQAALAALATALAE
jgi:hypothetical protein